MRCEKWDSPKVSWKFNDSSGYDTRYILKRGLVIFLTCLSQEKKYLACELALIKTNGYIILYYTS